MSLQTDIDQLAAAGLLTERQAQAYVLREIELVPRQAAADWMGVSDNVLDKHLRAAKDKVESAEATVDAIDDLRFEEVPDACAACGDPLTGQWAEADDGAALCLACAGLD